MTASLATLARYSESHTCKSLVQSIFSAEREHTTVFVVKVIACYTALVRFGVVIWSYEIYHVYHAP